MRSLINNYPRLVCLYLRLSVLADPTLFLDTCMKTDPSPLIFFVLVNILFSGIHELFRKYVRPHAPFRQAHIQVHDSFRPTSAVSIVFLSSVLLHIQNLHV